MAFHLISIRLNLFKNKISNFWQKFQTGNEIFNDFKNGIDLVKDWSTNSFLKGLPIHGITDTKNSLFPGQKFQFENVANNLTSLKNIFDAHQKEKHMTDENFKVGVMESAFQTRIQNILFVCPVSLSISIMRLKIIKWRR